MCHAQFLTRNNSRASLHSGLLMVPRPLTSLSLPVFLSVQVSGRCLCLWGFLLLVLQTDVHSQVCRSYWVFPFLFFAFLLPSLTPSFLNKANLLWVSALPSAQDGWSLLHTCKSLKVTDTEHIITHSNPVGRISKVEQKHKLFDRNWMWIKFSG